MINPIPQIDMAEATRLTREGKLDEAVALLRGRVSAAAAPRPKRPASPPVLDLAPPSAANGGVWTEPRPAARPSSPKPAAAAAGRGAMPIQLEGLLGRLGDLGSMPPLGSGAGAGGLGSPALPAGAAFGSHVFSTAEGSLAYKLYVPSGYRGEPLPLVVMLHGCTQSADDFAAGTGMNALAEEELFLVAYPMQTQAANASKCWNWFKPGDQGRDRGEPALIAGVTRQILDGFAIEAGRVYIAGLSAGGAAAAIMGEAYPDLFAAVGVHSGLACGAASDMMSALTAMRQGGPKTADRTGRRRAPTLPVPTIVFHGDRDGTVHPVNGDQVIAQAGHRPALETTVSHDVAPGGIRYTRTVQSDGSGRPMLEQWVLHGAGHAWSGGSAAGSYTEPRGPDASRAMLRFFRHHAALPPS